MSVSVLRRSQTSAAEASHAAFLSSDGILNLIRLTSSLTSGIWRLRLPMNDTFSFLTSLFASLLTVIAVHPDDDIQNSQQRKFLRGGHSPFQLSNEINNRRLAVDFIADSFPPSSTRITTASWFRTRFEHFLSSSLLTLGGPCTVSSRGERDKPTATRGAAQETSTYRWIQQTMK